MTVWLLGDQLSPDAAPLATADHVLMIEAHGFAERLPYHPAKLTLLFSAMRHCRDELRDRGYEVTYVEAETFGEGLSEYFEAAPDDALVLMDPPSHGAAARFTELVEERGGTLTVVENDRFLTSPDLFDEWAGDRSVDEGFRQEQWYRFVRREFDILMDGDEPEGGAWNYDDQNRETPPDGWSPPPTPTFDPDALTREVHEFVTERYADHWGNPSLEAVVRAVRENLV
jgi:deoxyribodipyrimidine photolyase-related protein